MGRVEVKQADFEQAVSEVRLTTPQPNGVTRFAVKGIDEGIVEMRFRDFLTFFNEADDCLLMVGQITPALGGASGTAQGLNAFRRWYPHGLVWTGPHYDSIIAACRGLVAKVEPPAPSTDV
jgi:hypothetical protein